MSSAGVTALSPVRDEPVVFPNNLHSEFNLCSKESIMVCLAMSGSMTPMRVLESDSIDSVKLRIQTCKGFVVKNQKLVCGGRELARSDSLVRDYGVADGNVLHLVLRLSDLQAINVRTPPPQLIDGGVRDVDGENYWGKYDVGGRNSDRGYEADGEILPRKPPDRDFLLEPVIVNHEIKLPSVVWNMVNSTYGGLESGHYPIRSMEGTGGAYFMLDTSGQKYASVFKPIDEEPMAVNNPRGLPLSLDGEGLKKGTRVGEGAFREVAAYILDHPKGRHHSLFGEGKGFAGVPPTFMVKCLHRGFNHPGDLTVKIGSLQMFMENNGSCEDMGPGAFPVEEVHKISVLDIRLANADRHAGNILLSKEQVDGKTQLIPIDHGYCLPETFEDCTFEWLYWPQARQPYSTETIDYIRSLDAEEDISLLKFHGWDVPLECARTLRISTMLLKKGVERGLNPFAIGSMMCRENLKKESVIEEIVQEAQDSVLPSTSEATFLETVSQIMDHHLDKIARFPFS